MTTLRRALSALIAMIALCSMINTALAVTPADYNDENPGALENDHLYAESAFLVDMDTGEILLNKNSRVRMYPASTTKIMTLILGLESGIPLDQVVTMPPETDDVPKGSSVIGIKSGDQMTWSDLLYGFMLMSGNDGSNAIAVLTAGSIDAFVQRMNQKAAELHCEGTQFTNAHGYQDENHYTTAQDLARMSLYAMQNETFRQIVASPRKTISITRGGKSKTGDAQNRNSLVVPESKYYYPGANGIKTGHHNQAGWCVVASATRSDVRLMAVILNCATEDKKWQDAKKLFNYGYTRYAQYSMAELLNQMQTELCTVKIDNVAEDDPNGDSMLLRYANMTGGNVQRMIQRNSEKAMQLAQEDIRKTLNIQWNRELVAPVSAGEVLGTLSFTAPDGSTVSAELTATRDVAARPEPTPSPTPTIAPPVETPKDRGDAASDAAPRAERTPNPHNTGAIRVMLVIVILALLTVAALLIVAHNRRERRRREMQRRRAAQRRKAQAARRRTAVRQRDVE